MKIFHEVFETFAEASSAIHLFKQQNPQYKTYDVEITEHEYDGDKCYIAVVYDDAY